MVGSASALHYLSCTTPPCVLRFWDFSRPLLAVQHFLAFSSYMQTVEDSCLKALFQDLPAVLLNGKAANTNKKYERGFNAWRKWASQFKEIVIFPASSVCFFVFS